MTVVWRGASERANGELVSGNYFDVLGVRPALGRVFNAADDRTPGAHPVAVLSYGYWQRRFGGDPAVLNQTHHRQRPPDDDRRRQRPRVQRASRSARPPTSWCR